MSYGQMHKRIVDIFKTAVSAVNPYQLIRSGIQFDKNKQLISICSGTYPSNANYYVVGFGKAVMGMAAALQDILGDKLKTGVLSVPISSQITVRHPIRVYEGGRNNLPDDQSVKATEEILRLTQNIKSSDILIVLISGGGSTLFCKPINEITLEDKLLTIKQLTQAGADIQDLNTVRKRLSQVKGGGFLQFCGDFQTVCLILSDVIGDPLTTIASGPTVRNTDHPDAAWEVIRKFKLELKIPKHIVQSMRKEVSSIKSLPNIRNVIIGNNEIALKSAKSLADTEDFKVSCISCQVSGLVDKISNLYFDIAQDILIYKCSEDRTELYSKFREQFRSLHFPVLANNTMFEVLDYVTNPKIKEFCLLLGGETTVEVKGTGKGGRNQELALRFAQLIGKLKEDRPELFKNWNVALLSAGTDGIDGPTDVAGAIGSAELFEDAVNSKIDIDSFINNNDSYTLIDSLGSGKYFVKTGHTGTNVMDIHILCFYHTCPPIFNP